MDKYRVNLNMPIDTLKRLDEYAEKMTITRTSAILVLVNQALDAQSTVNALDKLTDMLKNGNV